MVGHRRRHECGGCADGNGRDRRARCPRTRWPRPWTPELEGTTPRARGGESRGLGQGGADGLLEQLTQIKKAAADEPAKANPPAAAWAPTKGGRPAPVTAKKEPQGAPAGAQGVGGAKTRRTDGCDKRSWVQVSH